MRRIIFGLVLALTGTLGFGVMAPALPAAHAAVLAPTLTVPTTVAAGNTVAIAGQNFTPYNWVYFYFQRPDGTTNAVFAQTNAAGQFAVTLGFSPSHGTGIERLTAYDYGTARWSPLASIVVTGSVPLPVRQVLLSSTSVSPGNTITVSGQGFTPINWVYVYFQRPNGTAGTYWVQTGPNGSFASPLGFAAANGCGTETIWAYDYATQHWSAASMLTVTGCTSLAAPSGLQLLSLTQQQTPPQTATASLHWQDNSTAETGFRVRATFIRLYGGTDSQTWDIAANTTTTSVNFVSGGFNSVKTVCFTVSALNGAAESAPSNQVCANL